MRCRILLPMIMLLSGVLGVAVAAGQHSSAGGAMPASWENGWQQPPLSDRDRKSTRLNSSHRT